MDASTAGSMLLSCLWPFWHPCSAGAIQLHTVGAVLLACLCYSQPELDAQAVEEAQYVVMLVALQQHACTLRSHDGCNELQHKLRRGCLPKGSTGPAAASKGPLPTAAVAGQRLCRRSLLRVASSIPCYAGNSGCLRLALHR